MALDAKDMTKAEEILKAWDYADANDPELYVSYFNFFTVKSLDAGVIGATGYDGKYAQKALEFITEGIDRFPTRFDMRIAKIYMLGKLKDYPGYTSEIIKMIDYSDEIKNNWKGENFTVVENPDEMFKGAVLDFQEFLFTKEDTTLYKDIIRISEEMLKYYPKDVQSRLNISTVHVAQREYSKSIETLLKAADVEPGNSVLLYNIAYVYNLKGDKENAKKYYELTIKHIGEKEEKLKEAAQKQLEALK
jgi:tetratricopeptide (TPR) repeat protein